MPTLEETLMRRRGQGGIAAASPSNTPATPTYGQGYRQPQSQQQGGSKVGIGDTTLFRDPAWGTGITFATNAKLGAIDALNNAISQQNPADSYLLDQTRNAWANQLSSLDKNSDLRNAATGTQSQRGLANLLNTLKQTNAGTGNIGSRQYSGEQGDIASRIAAEYTNQMAQNKSQDLADLASVQGGLGNVYGQDLKERAFQAQQQGSLADLYTKLYQTELGRDANLSEQEQRKQEANQKFWTDIIGGAGQAGAMYAFSDSRVKKNIEDGKKGAREFISEIKPFIYEYKDKENGEGKHLGVMAQDLEKTEFGKSLVEDTKNGKRINYAKAFGVMLAVNADLNERLEKLERLANV